MNDFVNSILNRTYGRGYYDERGVWNVRELDVFENGVRRLLLEMEEDEFKHFISEIRYDRNRIRRSKKYWENNPLIVY